MVSWGIGKAMVEFLSAAAALVTIVAFLTPYVGIAEAVIIDVILIAGALVVGLWTRPRVPPSKPILDRSPSPSVQPNPPPQIVGEQTIVSKSFDVEAGKLTKVELQVHDGDYVFGTLEEEEHNWFSWYIVDIKNLRKMEQGRTFDDEVGEGDVPSTAMEWTVRTRGPWYLVLDVSMKQYVRRVTVNLKRRPRQ